jgi:aminopeptidase N
MIVGEFDAVSAVGRGNMLTTVYCPPGKSASGAFALRVAVDSLALLEDLFGVPYMGSKSDLLAVPDFAAGEHGGARGVPPI